MPLSAETIKAPWDAVSGLELEGSGLTARLAFGLRNRPRTGRTTWLVLEVADGEVEIGGATELPSLEAPEENLEVVLGVAATEDVWSIVSSREQFLDAVAEQKFFLSGEAPFFIRNLPAIVDLWEAIGRL
jgi:hypothetical protein